MNQPCFHKDNEGDRSVFFFFKFGIVCKIRMKQFNSSNIYLKTPNGGQCPPYKITITEFIAVNSCFEQSNRFPPSLKEGLGVVDMFLSYPTKVFTLV